jgi:hypothetical protein
VFTNVIPHREENALSFVVTRTVGVRLSKITGNDWAIDGAHDVREADVLGGASQHIATADTTF